MAGTEKLSAEDLPTGKFLNRVAENVDADYIRSIASDLDIKDSTFSQLSSDIHGARDLIYRVKVHLYQASASPLGQLFNDASNNFLIENNEVA